MIPHPNHEKAGATINSYWKIGFALANSLEQKVPN
jgi:hypothetical protein